MKHRMRKFTAAVMSCILCGTVMPVSVFAAEPADTAAELHAKYDPRTEEPEILTAVKNQTSPICWSYSSLGCIESNLIKKGYADNTLNLSEAHLIWFSRGKDSPDDPDDPRHGGGKNLGKEAYRTGSYTINTVAALAAWQGIVTDSDALTLTQTPVMAESERYRSSAHLQNADYYKASEKDGIKASILKNGPMILGYFCAENYPLSAKAGYYNADITMEAARRSDLAGGWHSVMVVGWDDTYSKENFTVPAPGDGAWIIKNSYGNFQRSENGYFYMSYYEPTIDEVVSVDMEPVTNYGAVHSYDCSDLSTTYFSEKNCGLMLANVFEAKEPETVTAVGFFSAEQIPECKICVYKLNPDAENPEDGTPAIEMTANIAHKGYHTIKLPESFKAETGQKYSVTVRMPIETIQPAILDSGCYKAGVSYYRFYTAEEEKPWKDCFRAGRGDCTIHVYTEYTGEEKDPFIKNADGTLIDAYPEPLMRETLRELDTNHDGYFSREESAASYTGVIYDINRDGLSDSRDLTLLKRAILGLQESGSGYDWKEADIDINCVYEYNDVHILKCWTLQKSTKE